MRLICKLLLAFGNVTVISSGVAREGTGGDSSPPVVLKTNFEIFLNLKRRGGGGGTDDSNF